MELTHLVAPIERLDEVPSLAKGLTLVVSFSGADTVIATAFLGGHLHGPIGIWLEVSEHYPAQMAARDVATLSWIVELDHVVIESDLSAEEYAQVVRVLLSDDRVNFSNEVATLTNAYNRPAPPRTLTVWSLDETTLRSPGREPLVAVSAASASGETRYA